MSNSSRSRTIAIARNSLTIFFAVIIFFMIINIIVLVITIMILLKSRSAMCEPSHVVERDEEVVELSKPVESDQTTYNIISNSYSYAYCSNKHCVQMGNSIYFAGEYTPYGKLLTATPSRLICEISPTEYNVVYRIK